MILDALFKGLEALVKPLEWLFSEPYLLLGILILAGIIVYLIFFGL